MPEEVCLSFVPNPGTIDPSYCNLNMVTDTDLMQAAAEQAYPVGEDGVIQVQVQPDCIRLYVESFDDIMEAEWLDDLDDFLTKWFEKHYPDCSIFHQDPPEAPPTLAQLHEALGKPDMDALAEVARWAVNGIAYGRHGMQFANGVNYLCTHETQFYAAIAGMATELIQHLAVQEHLADKETA